jgi:2-hydroxychromene-2-carboxylate isomerase
MIEIDRERVEDLTAIFGRAIRDHYRNNLADPARVLEVVNALGMAAASVLGALEDHGLRDKLLGFLVECVEINIVEVQNILENKHDG